jgi:hypothetical protein
MSFHELRVNEQSLLAIPESFLEPTSSASVISKHFG